MNKPYTCHNCSTEFEALTDDVIAQFRRRGQPPPERVRLKCPGCYDAGYTSVDQMIYILDISGDATLYVP